MATGIICKRAFIYFHNLVFCYKILYYFFEIVRFIHEKYTNICHTKIINCYKSPFLTQICSTYLYLFMVLKRQPKTGSCRLPTHRRNAYRNFFLLSLLILRSKFLPYVHCSDRYATKGQENYCIALFKHFDRYSKETNTKYNYA